MNVSDLKIITDRLVETGHGELKISIPLQGVANAHVSIETLLPGFDWSSGYAEIHYTARNKSGLLADFDLWDFEYVKEEYLRKISNISSILLGKTLEARYKKEKQVFETKFAAERWLKSKLREEIKIRK